MDGGQLDPGTLPIGDLDAIVVELRRTVLGDRIVAEGHCERCGAPIDIEFALSEFEVHRRPRTPRNVERATDGSWRLLATEVSFRVPTVADVRAAAGRDRPVEVLSERCIDGELGGGRRARVERALASIAPRLASTVTGECPECRQTVPLWVDARELCLADLRFLAASVFDDVHQLGWAYKWREADILAMPSARRGAYADTIRVARGAPLTAEAFGA